MVSPEQNDPAQERLVELANTVGNAVLVLNRGIDADAFVHVCSLLDRVGNQKELSLVLDSPGGSIEYAFRIAKAVRARCDYLEVIVPARAKSAATLIALAADRILFGEFGELGPLDPQVPDFTGSADYRSPLEIVKGLEYLRNYYVETFDVMVRFLLRRARMDVAHTMDRAAELLNPIADPLYRLVNYRELGEASRDLAVSEEYAKEAMRRWSPLDEDTASDIVEILVWEYPDHGYIIDIEEARGIGLSNVFRMSAGLEGLCFGVIDSQESFVRFALPDDSGKVVTENGSGLTQGGESEYETEGDG